MNHDSNPRLPVHVRELMQAEALKTFPDELLSEAASRMRDHQVGSLMVVEADELVGILSERDILNAVAEGLSPDSTPWHAA
jgi:acetoin utilization protein AcuB